MAALVQKVFQGPLSPPVGLLPTDLLAIGVAEPLSWRNGWVYFVPYDKNTMTAVLPVEARFLLNEATFTKDDLDYGTADVFYGNKDWMQDNFDDKLYTSRIDVNFSRNPAWATPLEIVFSQQEYMDVMRQNYPMIRLSADVLDESDTFVQTGARQIRILRNPNLARRRQMMAPEMVARRRAAREEFRALQAQRDQALMAAFAGDFE